MLEKLRYQRIKNNEQKLLELKERKSYYYNKKKGEGKIKNIQDLTPRDQRLKRKQWKENSARYRNKVKELSKRAHNLMKNNTPPDSDVDEPEIEAQQQQEYQIEAPLQEQSPQIKDKRAVEGKRRSMMQRRLRNKIIKQKENQIAELKRKLKVYQRKLSKRNTKLFSSPKSKVKQIIKRNSKPEIKKKLFFSEIVKTQLTENAKYLRTQKEKEIFCRVLTGKYLKNTTR